MGSYIGEIKAVAYANFPQAGWLACNGQMVGVADYPALFAIIGTTYGGDGETSFALPNLQGRAMMGTGDAPKLTPRAAGAACGAAEVTLDTPQLPVHNHPFNAVVTTSDADTRASAPDPFGGTASVALGLPSFIRIANGRKGEATFKKGGASAPIAMRADAILPFSGLAPGAPVVPIDNMQPYLTLNYFICTEGDYPSSG